MPYELIPIRLSHLLGHSGVGAIVRGPKDLVIVHDIRQWSDRNGDPGGRVIPYVERIRAALSVEQELREPPVAREVAHGSVEGVCVPVSRFPGWTRCPSCDVLFQRPWSDADDGPPRCNRCDRKPILEQVTWVLVHPKGYLSEVPWHFLAHESARSPDQTNCQIRDRLRLTEDGVVRTLRCDACGASARFRDDRLVSFVARRMQPWTRDDPVPPQDPQADPSKGLAHVLAINDARVYAPVADIALVIPPESRVRKGTAVDRLYRNSEDRRKVDGARTPLARKGALREIAARYRCTPADIEEALQDIAKGYPLYGASFTTSLLRESEYEAYQETLPDQQPDEDLVTQNQTSGWQAMAKVEGVGKDTRLTVTSVHRLVRIDRLKAVKVFRGFKRPVQADDPLADNIVLPDIIGSPSWLPAVELYGEGIFITLNEVKLARWEKHQAVTKRLDQLKPRFTQSGRDKPNPLNARFLLLHTLSHLLMREIEAEGGYPAASLTEIIYCAQEPKPMAGILIYVAVPDIAGSLGGLAELAEPRRFLGILTRALEHGRWCSLDPVCSEHEGQGPGMLNRAACHACTLVPDTACEYGNTLLDRGFVKGNDDGVPAFFGME